MSSERISLGHDLGDKLRKDLRIPEDHRVNRIEIVAQVGHVSYAVIKRFIDEAEADAVAGVVAESVGEPSPDHVLIEAGKDEMERIRRVYCLMVGKP